MIGALNERSREIFRRIVDLYVDTGAPVGSKTLSQDKQLSLSPATIRNVMSDLEELGLLTSPHISAGRVPTEQGLRLFVDGMLQLGDLSEMDRSHIEQQCQTQGKSVRDVLTQASQTLSGLSQCAGLVLSPKADAGIRHIEFVSLSPGKALVILVQETGLVENRVIEVPLGLPVSTLQSAANYMNRRLAGKTLQEAQSQLELDATDSKAQLDGLTSKVIEAGLASWGGNADESHLIIRGQSHLLEDITALQDLERIRQLFQLLEKQEMMMSLLEEAQTAEGVQIFIGAESRLFQGTGCSMVVAPYRDGQQKVVGTVGVIGPTRLNYARVIPMVDYTAQVVGRILG